jgi:hypothetical protein
MRQDISLLRIPYIFADESLITKAIEEFFNRLKSASEVFWTIAFDEPEVKSLYNYLDY